MNHWRLLFITFLTVSSNYGQVGNPKMEPLLPGNLDQWKVPEKNIWWSLQDTVLIARNDSDKVGSILWTKKEYTDFVIELDFKFGTGTVDSGIFMRGDTERDVQIQIGISGSLKRDMTGSPYVPGLGYPVEAEGVSGLLEVDKWNTLRAMARGDSYRVWLNGTEILQYSLDSANPQGPIGLQLHPGNEMTIHFKNIRVADMK